MWTVAQSAKRSNLLSDPVALHVEALQDVAVSLFVSGTDVQPSASEHHVVAEPIGELE